MNDRLGRLHFWGSLIGMNGIFLPMFMQGLAGMNRRLYDGGRTYDAVRRVRRLVPLQAWSAVLLGVVQLFFIVNFVLEPAGAARASATIRGRRRRSSGRRRRRRRTTTSPATPTVHRGPYDYSVPGAAADFMPQSAAMIPYTIERRADTGVTNVTLGIWLFLASEVMLFGALFSAYALLRVVGAGVAVAAATCSSLPLGAMNTVVLIAHDGVAWQARSAPIATARRLLLVSCGVRAGVPGHQGARVRAARFGRGLVPSVEHVPGDVLHADRPARAARHRRARRESLGDRRRADASARRMTARPRPGAVALLGVRGRRLARSSSCLYVPGHDATARSGVESSCAAAAASHSCLCSAPSAALRACPICFQVEDGPSPTASAPPSSCWSA